MTNGFETVAVNKQTNPNLTLTDILFYNNDKTLELSQQQKFKNFISVIFHGWKPRSIYYGIQASFFFLYFDHLKTYMGFEEDEDE